MALRIKRERLRIKDARVFSFRHVLDEIDTLRLVTEIQDHNRLVVILGARETVEHVVTAGLDTLKRATVFTVPQGWIVLVSFENTGVEILVFIVVPLHGIFLEEREAVRRTVDFLLAALLTGIE